jgi:membrane protein DedA with SNARE-associated domain
LAQKGGRSSLEKRFGEKRISKVYRRFERWGFGAVAIPALLPPPFPIVPFLLAAGAMQYSRKKFLAALAAGRGIRFTILAVLGTIYGTHIVRFFSKYYKPSLIVLIAVSVIAGILALSQYLRNRTKPA